MYLTNDLMNWADWLNDICILRVMDIHWSYQNLLFWTGIVWHRLSANQIVRCFKLRKLKNYMGYQVDFLLPLKLQKISYYFGLCRKILLANQFAGFFTFDLFDLLILIPGVHCYIVLVSKRSTITICCLYYNNLWGKCKNKCRMSLFIVFGLPMGP